MDQQQSLCGPGGAGHLHLVLLSPEDRGLYGGAEGKQQCSAKIYIEMRIFEFSLVISITFMIMFQIPHQLQHHHSKLI